MKLFCEELRAPKNPKLDKIDPNETFGISRTKAEARLEYNKNLLGHLGYKLYAEGKRSVLIVLQAMDTAGKDGVIRHVLTGLNPQGVKTTSFKVPTPIEAAHDFLWRVHMATPAVGEIGVFNRSHYEDVLVQRVRKIVPEKVWKQRYNQINEFEELLAENRTTIVKFFLHISKDEQAKRIRDRIKDDEKNWKFSKSDLEERKLWEDYMAAYETALDKCNADHAPWYIIPSNKKWFRNLATSEILVETLTKMDPKIPDPIPDLDKIKVE